MCTAWECVCSMEVLVTAFWRTGVRVVGASFLARNNCPPEATFFAGSGRPPRPPGEVCPRCAAMPENYPPSSTRCAQGLALPGQGGRTLLCRALVPNRSLPRLGASCRVRYGASARCRAVPRSSNSPYQRPWLDPPSPGRCALTPVCSPEGCATSPARLRSSALA